MNPSDDDCIYSTLTYIQTQAQRLNVPTPCVTFNQPLWINKIKIFKHGVQAWWFSHMMSFVGSIGQMMKGSGLEEALETIYGPNAVNHMMSGKAISRALRGHFLVEAALVNKLIAAVLPAELERNDDSVDGDCDDENDTETLNEEEKTLEGVEKISPEDVQKIRDLYQEMFTHSASMVSMVESNEFIKLEQCLMKYKMLLEERSPTAKLWLQYIEYIGILKLFIRAERTGNWSLHLLAVTKMLNLFAATGHINYAKSARFYVQLMQFDLPSEHPWLHQCFINKGYHTVRRSSRYWGGLWTDLVIEQVMMRSIKSRGGLTRGRGLTESVRHQWIFSMHKCAGVHDAMTTMTKLKSTTSEQHVDLGVSRCKRDFHDLKKFKSGLTLMNLLTWMREDCVHCHPV